MVAELAPRLPPDAVIVDVGADHGHVTHALRTAGLPVVASERAPGIAGRPELPWVLADGLAPFRRVDVAVIAGMGARTIARILQRGPRPTVAAVLHAQDDPPRLRTWLAADGWRFEAEGLAPEARRYAEVMRVVPGEETATGETLALGPRLLSDGHPLLEAHLRQLHGHWTSIARATHGHDALRHAAARARVERIERAMQHRR